MSDPMDTLSNPYLTYHYDKVSCMKGAFLAHVIFSYLVMFTGVSAFVTRVVKPLKWMHVWFGRGYILSMLWATATSLIIHNSGLPAATLVSFIWVMAGLTIGWIIIKFHEARLERQAIKNVEADISQNGWGVDGKDLAARIVVEKVRIADNKTFVQRFFSIKALHGVIMFVSWINVAGRVFATNLSNRDFTCHTYPVYKPIDVPGSVDVTIGTVDMAKLKLLPAHDPNYARLPWARMGLVQWGVVMLIGPFLGAYLIGAIWSAIAVWGKKRKARAGAEVPATGFIAK